VLALFSQTAFGSTVSSAQPVSNQGGVMLAAADQGTLLLHEISGVPTTFRAIAENVRR
jgi:hypothetical protein